MEDALGVVSHGGSQPRGLAQERLRPDVEVVVPNPVEESTRRLRRLDAACQRRTPSRALVVGWNERIPLEASRAGSFDSVEFRPDPARAEDGDPNVRSVRGQVEVERFRQRNDGALCHAVRLPPGDESRERRDVHDVTRRFLFDQPGDERPQPVKDPVEVDAHHPVPVVRRACQHGRGHAAAGVAD